MNSSNLSASAPDAAPQPNGFQLVGPSVVNASVSETGGFEGSVQWLNQLLKLAENSGAALVQRAPILGEHFRL